MNARRESRVHAHTRTTGGDDADAICSALEIRAGEPPVTIPSAPSLASLPPPPFPMFP